MSATSWCGLCAGLASKPLQLPPAFSLLWEKTVLCQEMLINISYC